MIYSYLRVEFKKAIDSVKQIYKYNILLSWNNNSENGNKSNNFEEEKIALCN